MMALTEDLLRCSMTSRRAGCPSWKEVLCVVHSFAQVRPEGRLGAPPLRWIPFHLRDCFLLEQS